MQDLRERVWCAVSGACGLRGSSLEVVLEDGVEHQVLAEDLMALVFGEGFVVLEDLRVKELLVGGGGLQEGLWAL